MGELGQLIARNETTFREANEDLRASWRELELETGQEALFVCECGNPRCTRVMRLTIAEYEKIRANPNTFAVLPGHDDEATEQIVTGEVVEQNDRFTIVKKRPENREATEATDPRT